MAVNGPTSARCEIASATMASTLDHNNSTRMIQSALFGKQTQPECGPWKVADWPWPFIAGPKFGTQPDGTTGDHRPGSFFSPLIWAGNKLRLVHHVDHIDGDLADSEARRSLCPNCHYCRETTAARSLTTVAEVGAIIRGATQAEPAKARKVVCDNQGAKWEAKDNAVLAVEPADTHWRPAGHVMGGGGQVTQHTTLRACSQGSGC